MQFFFFFVQQEVFAPTNLDSAKYYVEKHNLCVQKILQKSVI